MLSGYVLQTENERQKYETERKVWTVVECFFPVVVGGEVFKNPDQTITKIS